MTPDELLDRLEEAGRTLKRTPIPRGELPPKVKALWPDAPDEWTAYGYTPVKVVRTLPTPEEISRLDEVLGWLLPLDADVRAVVLARACGASWRAIMRARQRLGYRGSHEHCRAIFRRGVSEIGTQLEVGLVVLSTGHD
jgi:hypothetical protein